MGCKTGFSDFSLNITEVLERLTAIEARLTGVEGKLDQLVSGAPVAATGGADEGDVVARVGAYDTFLSTAVADFEAASAKYGGGADDISKLLVEALKNTRGLVEKATTMKKPSDEELPGHLEPVSTIMMKIMEASEKAKRDDYLNAVKAISEAQTALQWVVMAPAPVPFMKDVAGGRVTYTNKILMKEKNGGNADAVAWVKALDVVFNDLIAYVKEHHTTGLTWSVVKKATTSKPKAPSAAPAAAGGLTTIIDTEVAAFSAACDKLGGEIASLAPAFADVFAETQKLIVKAKTIKGRPSDEKLGEDLLPGLSGAITKLMGAAEGLPRDFSNYGKSVSEAIPMFSWVMIQPAPFPFAKEFIGSSQFWSNKILSKEKNGGNADAVAWVKALNAVLSALPPFIKAEHTTGLTFGR